MITYVLLVMLAVYTICYKTFFGLDTKIGRLDIFFFGNLTRKNTRCSSCFVCPNPFIGVVGTDGFFSINSASVSESRIHFYKNVIYLADRHANMSVCMRAFYV